MPPQPIGIAAHVRSVGSVNVLPMHQKPLSVNVFVMRPSYNPYTFTSARLIRDRREKERERRIERDIKTMLAVEESRRYKYKWMRNGAIFYRGYRGRVQIRGERESTSSAGRVEVVRGHQEK